MFQVLLIIIGFLFTKKKAEQSNSDSGENREEKPNSNTTQKIIIIAFGIFLYLTIKTQIEEKKKNDTLLSVATDPYAQYAQQIRTATNPSGFGWMDGYDGTDVNTIMNVAGQIGTTGFPKVVTAYQNMYGKNLVEVLTSELGNDQFQDFLLRLKGVSVPTTGTNPTTPVVPTVKRNKYEIAGKTLPYIMGKLVIVNRGYKYKIRDKVFNAGDAIGRALGWRMVGGKVNVVVDAQFGIIFTSTVESVVDAQGVRTE